MIYSNLSTWSMAVFVATLAGNVLKADPEELIFPILRYLPVHLSAFVKITVGRTEHNSPRNPEVPMLTQCYYFSQQASLSLNPMIIIPTHTGEQEAERENR